MNVFDDVVGDVCLQDDDGGDGGDDDVYSPDDIFHDWCNVDDVSNVFSFSNVCIFDLLMEMILWNHRDLYHFLD